MNLNLIVGINAEGAPEMQLRSAHRYRLACHYAKSFLV